MWERMQQEGYFSEHSHYSDHYGAELNDSDKALDEAFLQLDYSVDNILMPAPYSEELERAVKRTEAFWLYEMFDLPKSGTAYDLGCGFGRSVRWLSEIYELVHGSDISAEIIATAKENLRHKQNISFFVNDADTVPDEIPAESVQVAYIFTVFQHIPREFAQELLSQVKELLATSGSVVFNLLSGMNEQLNSGEDLTEWAIGYEREQAIELVQKAGLKIERITRWSRPEHDLSWLWVHAKK